MYSRFSIQSGFPFKDAVFLEELIRISQSFIVLSQLPEESKWLSQIDFKELMLFECPFKLVISLLSF